MKAHELVAQHFVDEHHNRVCVPLDGRCLCPEPATICARPLLQPGHRNDGSAIVCLMEVVHGVDVAHRDSPVNATGTFVWGEQAAMRRAATEPAPDHLCGAAFHKPGDPANHLRQCTRDQHETGAHDDPRRRDLSCIGAWPECNEGEYDPRCCRFPKSCSADVHHSLLHTRSSKVEPEPKGVPSSSRESSGAVDAQTTEQPGAVRPDAPHDHVRCFRCHRTDGGHLHDARCGGLCSSVDVPIAPTPETEAEDHGLFVHEVPRYLPSRGRRREEPEDPPGVDVYADPGTSNALPPITEAAERVAYFIRAFGDGKIMGREDGLPPLYARDLEVLAQAHDPNRRR